MKGNTAGLVEAFKQGAEKAGHTVEVFNLQRMDIHPCLGCLGGGCDSQNPCVQKDDMVKIYPYYETADVLVLASPMYAQHFSSKFPHENFSKKFTYNTSVIF